jgi:hypothetical protein
MGPCGPPVGLRRDAMPCTGASRSSAHQNQRCGRRLLIGDLAGALHGGHGGLRSRGVCGVHAGQRLTGQDHRAQRLDLADRPTRGSTAGRPRARPPPSATTARPRARVSSRASQRRARRGHVAAAPAPWAGRRGAARRQGRPGRATMRAKRSAAAPLSSARGGGAAPSATLATRPPSCSICAPSARVSSSRRGSCTVPVRKCNRFLHLQRVAGGVAQHLVHVGDQRAGRAGRRRRPRPPGWPPASRAWQVVTKAPLPTSRPAPGPAARPRASC